MKSTITQIQNMENTKLQEELEHYINGRDGFSPYYPGMSILSSNLYKEQLREILTRLEKENSANAKSFEMYLETIIINMQTKAKKYKQSIYLNNENIKDIENQGYTIPFYFDENKKVYVLLGILNAHEQ